MQPRRAVETTLVLLVLVVPGMVLGSEEPHYKLSGQPQNPCTKPLYHNRIRVIRNKGQGTPNTHSLSDTKPDNRDNHQLVIQQSYLTTSPSTKRLYRSKLIEASKLRQIFFLHFGSFQSNSIFH